MPVDLAQIVSIPSLQSDIRVFGFLVVVAVFSAILFGLAPAIHATRIDVVRITKGDVLDVRPTKLRNALVIGQITACAMLLTCAGLSLRANGRMNKQEVGFTTKNILELDISEKHRPRVLSRLAEESEVQAIAAAQSIPLNGMLSTAPMIAGEATAFDASYNFVSPTFFQVLDIPILSGRNFTQEEALTGAAVAIISHKTALRYWPSQQALGQTIRITPELEPGPESKLRGFPVVRIIGIAADIVSCCFTIGTDPSLIYLPTTYAAKGTELLVRVNGSSDQGREILDKTLAPISPDAVEQIHSLETFQAAGLFPFRIAAAVCAVIGGLALLLALSGVYGVLSYSVSQRTREIGIRMAIGAPANAVALLVLKQSMRLALLGSAAGLVLAFAAWRILASRVFFMKAFDGMSFVIGVLVPLASAAVAAYVPARRALLVDPAATLRHD